MDFLDPPLELDAVLWINLLLENIKLWMYLIIYVIVVGITSFQMANTTFICAMLKNLMLWLKSFCFSQWQNCETVTFSFSQWQNCETVTFCFRQWQNCQTVTFCFSQWQNCETVTFCFSQWQNCETVTFCFSQWQNSETVTAFYWTWLDFVFDLKKKDYFSVRI